MRLPEYVSAAISVYLDCAFPEGPPLHIREELAQLIGADHTGAWWALPFLERDGACLAWRTGNGGYPHMRLVIKLEQGLPWFSVDTHDSHFPVAPDYAHMDRLKALRDHNAEIRCAVEAKWRKLDLPQNLNDPSGDLGLGSCRVLLVDDEWQILQLLKAIVTGLGASCWLAESVEEARNTIQNQPFIHGILSDIMMQGESGYDLVYWLRSQSSDIPVFYVTGLPVNQVNRRGVQGVVQKPFTVTDIRQVLNQMMSRIP